jgi:hypothetical protein
MTDNNHNPSEIQLPFSCNEKLLKQFNNRFLFSTVMGIKLPLAFFAGLKVEKVSPIECAISLPYGWRSQNPFRSIYFAAQAMAAEMSTGILGKLACDSSNESVAMLVTGLHSEFTKKANQKTIFTCTEGLKVFEAVQHTIETGEGVKVELPTIGRMTDGTEVSQFTFQWSFKKRIKK